MSEPWRYRCPEGHSAIEVHKHGYRCQSCGERYLGDPVDARRVDGFPVEGEHGSAVDDVLQRIVAVCERSERAFCRGREVAEDDARTIGQRIRQLHEQGLVERVKETNGRGYWRPTDDGVAASRERARMTPVGAGLLVFALGLVYLVAIMLFNGGVGL